MRCSQTRRHGGSTMQLGEGSATSLRSQGATGTAGILLQGATRSTRIPSQGATAGILSRARPLRITMRAPGLGRSGSGSSLQMQPLGRRGRLASASAAARHVRAADGAVPFRTCGTVPPARLGVSSPGSVLRAAPAKPARRPSRLRLRTQGEAANHTLRLLLQCTHRPRQSRLTRLTQAGHPDKHKPSRCSRLVRRRRTLPRTCPGSLKQQMRPAQESPRSERRCRRWATRQDRLRPPQPIAPL
mmetsp:Transcript_9871/g.22454  ORF Transcript_9871/g.22454 Transcript_9871/m.22454 type:complete len:244 (+) Transcript_9871:257-988(+)